MNLAAVIDFDLTGRLLNNLSQAMKLSLRLLDPSGNILISSGYQPRLCRESGGDGHCPRRIRNLLEGLDEIDSPRFTLCCGRVVMTVADNGLDAVELSLREKPDLIFLDIRMPGLTGLEAAAAIMEGWPQAVIHIISAYDEFDYARQAFITGVRDYLLKPVRTSQLKDLILAAAERPPAPPADPPPAAPLVRAGAAYVEANLDRSLSLAEIAEAVYISPFHLSRKFKSLSGRSLSGFIQDRRLAKAATLLAADPEASSTEVAGLVGFDNPSYFATRFKQATGLSPLQFRKKASVKKPA